MSEEMTASATETTVQDTQAAAVPEAQTTQTTADTNTQTTADTQTQEAPDYSWVPAKFLNDGEPDFQNLAKSYQNLEKKMASKVASLAPESIEEYTYVPEGLDLDPELSNAFKAEALEAGITPAQYEFIMNKYKVEMANMFMTPDKAADVLKQSWGDEFNGNLTAARKAFDEFAPSDLSMDDPALNHPSVLKLLASIGAELGEDATPAKSSKTAGLSRADIEAMMKTPEYYQGGSETYRTVTEWFQKNG